MTILWVLGGIAIGILNGVLLARAVRRLHPGGDVRVARAVAASVWGRWGVAAAVLMAALGQGVPAALGTFVGLWLGRWVIVVAVHSGRLRFDPPAGGG